MVSSHVEAEIRNAACFSNFLGPRCSKRVVAGVGVDNPGAGARLGHCESSQAQARMRLNSTQSGGSIVVQLMVVIEAMIEGRMYH